MKTNGATWKAYLNSWPKGQWFDDSDERYDGTPASFITDDEWLPQDSAVVEFTCGVVYTSEDTREGMDLVRHFKAWQKSLSHETVVCEVPKECLPEFLQTLKSIKGKRLS